MEKGRFSPPTGSREPIHPAAEPIRLPEFGNIEFGWGMCRNSMCPNFCVLYGSGEAPPDAHPGYGPTRESGRLGKLQCRVCGLSIPLHSTTSLREIARHFLSLSLPFADCPNDRCRYHGVNAFEYFGRTYPDEQNRRPYRSARQHELTCKACGKSFALGSPLWLRDKRGIHNHSRRVLHSVAMGRPIADAINSGLKTASYYRQMLRMADRLRDYLAYRNAHLLRPTPGRADRGTALVFTDVMYAPLKRQEEGTLKGSQFALIVSAVKLRRTYYVLAAHPYYLPKSKCPDTHALEADKEKPHFLERRWDALRTFLDDREMLDEKGEDSPGPPDEGQPGREIVSPYAEAAHFLVVDRMLSRFGRRFYYMDTSPALFDSAMVAMRDNIRRRRVEVVLYQHGGKGRARPGIAAGSGPGGRRTRTHLRGVFARAEETFGRRVGEAASAAPGEKGAEGGDLARRILWRRARVGGYSKAAEGAWLPYPPDYGNYRNCRTFWLTRRPGDTVDDGMDVLMNASMHSVDSAHWSIRSRAKGMERRASTSGGRGLGSSYYRFDVMSAELYVYLLHFNFCLFIRDRRKLPRAVPMGLADKRDRRVRPHDVAWNFRLGKSHAREIGRWLMTPP